MRYPKPSIITTGLLTTCLISGCQTLPLTAERSATLQTPPAVTPSVEPPVEVTKEEEETPLQIASINESFETTDAKVLEISQAVAVPLDTWERMRQGFSLTSSMHPIVISNLRWYRNHPDHIRRIQERAKPYIHFILNELEARQIPTEIALLPAIESAFQPFAYSPGHAAGIWQFIPSTGRSYGLKQNWWYDGRRDIVASTRAALDYLKSLNRRFDGDWELALAAYNAGAGTVQKAIRKNRKKAKATDFWSLKLPKETRNYVPRLLALSQIFATPEEFGIKLQSIADEPFFKTVKIESQLDLALAAEMSDLTTKELYRLNSAFNRWATDPEGPHELHLPLNKVEGFLQQLAQLPAEKRLRWKRYKIKNGDSLSVIAQRHGTSTQALKQVNKLRNSKIRAGKHLLIPISTKNHVPSALSAQLPKSQSQHSKGVVSSLRYVVKKGDSLWEIAKAHHVKHTQLAKWNGIAPGGTLRPGQKLVIRQKITASETLSVLDHQPAGTQNTVSYKVRQGDSLYRIAERFSVTVPELKKWNSLPGKYLQPGQQIKLYMEASEQQTL